MSVIKSYAVGNGDMFYIEHGSDNFTIIDCCLNDDMEDDVLDEVAGLDKRKGVTRFISTHPDEDHLRGLERLDDEIGIRNFYCVKNQTTKDDLTDSFKRYCELRDSDKAFYIKKGCTRRWMNEDSDNRKSSGIDILWPERSDEDFKAALQEAENGGSPNNISAVIRYRRGSSVALWMGDLETDFMKSIKGALDLPKVSLLFAPHHGRLSGRVPNSMLRKMSPKVIVIGEAPSEHLHYYDDYNTITQNTAGDIIFQCDKTEIDVFTSNEYEASFLEDKGRHREGYHYAGTLRTSD